MEFERLELSVAEWRRWLAYRAVAGHGLGMFVLIAAPLQFFLLLLGKEHAGAAWLAGGLMAAGFVGTLWLAPSLVHLSPQVSPSGPARRALLRRFRMFVGTGDAVQALARRIDPGWRNPNAGRRPDETARWLASMELMHWATLVGSIAPTAVAFIYGHIVLSLVYLVANLVYNIVPNLVIRETRQPLQRVQKRRRAGVAG